MLRWPGIVSWDCVLYIVINTNYIMLSLATIEAGAYPGLPPT